MSINRKPDQNFDITTEKISSIPEKKKKKIESLRVIFIPNTEPVDTVFSDSMITQLMVTLTRVGLRVEHLDVNDAIIE